VVDVSNNGDVTNIHGDRRVRERALIDAAFRNRKQGRPGCATANPWVKKSQGFRANSPQIPPMIPGSRRAEQVMSCKIRDFPYPALGRPGNWSYRPRLVAIAKEGRPQPERRPTRLCRMTFLNRNRANLAIPYGHGRRPAGARLFQGSCEDRAASRGTPAQDSRFGWR
jgi:hypothetical protein